MTVMSKEAADDDIMDNKEAGIRVDREKLFKDLIRKGLVHSFFFFPF
jgi:hypothetical protein